MILLFALLGLVYGLVRGGSFNNLATSRFHYWPLIILAALAEFFSALASLHQILAPYQFYAILPTGLALVRYGAALVFLLANWRKTGSKTMLAGTFLNGLVIMANRGRMPLLPAQPLSDKALAKIAAAPNYFLATGQEPLLFLADRIQLFNYLLSPGDFLLAAGIFLLAANLSAAPAPDRINASNNHQ